MEIPAVTDAGEGEDEPEENVSSLGNLRGGCRATGGWSRGVEASESGSK